VDETSLNLNTPLCHCWQKRGQQRRIPAVRYAQTFGCCRIIGAYNWGTDTVHAHFPSHMRTETFLQFLEWLLFKLYPHHSLILVMDNASYHHAAAVKAFCALLEHRLQVIYLPPYCSSLNLIERYWRHLKHLACANRLFENLDQLASQVRRLIALQNQPLAPDHFSFVK